MKHTKDLWFSSFLLLKGYSIYSFSVESNKGTYFFDIEESEWLKLKLQFNESEVSRIKYLQEQLKDLCY